MNTYLFPGQGAQFEGMGKTWYETNDTARALFEQANNILGYRISDIMFTGTAEDLKQTKVTQPAIFLHSYIKSQIEGERFQPEAVAGHSLGEFSALVAAKALTFEDGLRLVQQRALAMQRACELQPSTMAAVLGLEDEIVEQVCATITDEIVVAANYNCPGQLVISGSIAGVEIACEKLKAAGAKRALILQVGGAFHSPLMEPAREELAAAIEKTTVSTPICAVYQNVNAKATTDPEEIKRNLIAQLTAPVRWTQTLKNMLADGAIHFYEVGGNGSVLLGMLKKIDRAVAAENL
ncbi:MAG: S-malonyltransferase [Bacteroidota bacterium]|jgi:[acyl-carrier-protein] S-malonyltransferase